MRSLALIVTKGRHDPAAGIGPPTPLRVVWDGPSTPGWPEEHCPFSAIPPSFHGTFTWVREGRREERPAKIGLMTVTVRRRMIARTPEPRSC
jgi:hypothetical protein